jgi:hypothetical protein
MSHNQKPTKLPSRSMNNDSSPLAKQQAVRLKARGNVKKENRVYVAQYGSSAAQNFWLIEKRRKRGILKGDVRMITNGDGMVWTCTVEASLSLCTI